MHARNGEFERISDAVRSAPVEGPLTASEIVELIEQTESDPPSAHRIATVLGKHAHYGQVEVIRGQPYRYRLSDP